MEKRDYYLGLDMGTSSIGWAVTDENYQLLRAKGKDLWGIREFDEALTAVERRTHRISRRRRQREKVRIGLLKKYFHEAIAEVDPLFYIRMENSKYFLEDKDDSVRSRNSVFDDETYKDADYYKEYPTIFHLRKELIYNQEPHDVRLVYLAILNMFKHRGHFLNAGLSSEENARTLQDAYMDFSNMVSDLLELYFPIDVDCKELENILSNREYNRTRKGEELAKLLRVEKRQKREMAFVKAICGLKIDIKLLFTDLEIEEKKDVCFSDISYEEKVEEIAGIVGEEYFLIMERMKEIYDIGSLAGILKGFSYLSDARVEDYEKHKKDLLVLKEVVRKYGELEDYNALFRSEESGSYSAYINSYNSGNKQRRSMKGRTQEELYKKIRNYLKMVPQDDEQVTYILSEIDKELFLPKQLTASNGIIPNQVHKKEMRKILKNAELYLPFLKEKDESGLSVSERILQLFSFQIPYYIGPTTTNSSKNGGEGWVVRKEEGQVLPWNIDAKIDKMKTAEEFISRLVRNCTYLNDEKVLPKASLEYESFCVLNEINSIKINGEKISVELKQEIYKELFQRGKKVTKKQLVKYLIGKGVLQEEIQLSGIDVNINNSLSSYGKFRAVFGEKIDEDSYKKMAEDIIFWCTVYGDSKKFLKEKIEEKYSEVITPEILKRIMGYKFKDWANLSKEFLEIQACDKTTGEVNSLIRTMWNDNINLMELLHSERYTFAEVLEEKQSTSLKCLSDLEPEDLDEWYFSAPVKRTVWQTILIIRELERILGGTPKRIFIEMTRNSSEKGDKGRKDSRKQQLLALYKNIVDEEIDWRSEIERADENGKLRSKKMYLYFTQMGRCMYSGKRIELSELFDNNLYDIDHIYPRHFVKDDNINNNLVLVDKKINAHKSDNYPLEEKIRSSLEIKNMWKKLRKSGLINEEKYRRLIRNNAFSDEDKAGFIARQLVEISQGTKGVADILKQVLPESKIVYAKATNVSEFRKKRDLVKSRLINDFHHAHDAYLNIVVGNVYYVKFTQNPKNFIKNEYKKDAEKYKYNLSRMFDWDVIRGNEVAWVASKKGDTSGTIAIVKKMLKKNTPLMTRLNYEGHGAIANATLYSAKKAKKEGYIPLKTTDEKMRDVKKYGGFSSVSTAYFFLVEHEVKGKKVRTLETVPIFLKEKIEHNPNELLKYCENELQLVNPSIRVKKIKLQSLIKRNGYFMHISGRTNNQIKVRNAVNLCLETKWNQYIKWLENFAIKGNLDANVTGVKNEELYDVLKEKHYEGVYKKRPNSMGIKLKEGKDKFIALTLEQQCQVLIQILNLSIIGPISADLSLIGGSKESGVMKFNKNIMDAEEFLVINQSVTGLIENSIDLLSV